MKITGTYKLVLKNPGKKPQVFKGTNLVVNNGKNLFAQIVDTNNGSATGPTHIGVGTSGLAVSELHTDLQTPSVVVARVALSKSRTANRITYSATIAAGASAEPVNEMGIFNASVAGTLVARFLPQSFTLEVGGSLAVTWAIQFGD
jgi:hypothetical protein